MASMEEKVKQIIFENIDFTRFQDFFILERYLVLRKKLIQEFLSLQEEQQVVIIARLKNIENETKNDYYSRELRMVSLIKDDLEQAIKYPPTVVVILDNFPITKKIKVKPSQKKRVFSFFGFFSKKIFN